MDNHTFSGKRRLGTTELTDFTDYQGVGHDPLYKRYETVRNVVGRIIPAEYQDFLAIPDYIAADDTINWYIPDWKETPEVFTELTGAKKDKYTRIKEATVNAYRTSLDRLSGEDLRIMGCAIRYLNDEFIYCCDDKVYVLAWGMTPDATRHISSGLLVHNAPVVQKYKITFDCGDHGKFKKGNRVTISVRAGDTLMREELPKVNVEEGYEFKGWIPDPSGHAITGDMSCEADYIELGPPAPPVIPPVIPEIPEPEIPGDFQCRFHAGPNGVIEGNSVLSKTAGAAILPGEIPKVKANKGYKFTGWNVNPANLIVNGDMDFEAQYTPKKSWFSDLGWLKWLLLALLIAALVFLILWLCSKCSRKVAINGVIPAATIEFEGKEFGDFGVALPIPVENGKLPADQETVTPPVRDADGTIPDIVRNPGVPPVFANRLILFLTDENGDIDEVAADFKRAYPGSQYEIIGFDRYVKSLVIKVPASEREQLKQTLPTRLPNHNFIVFDEEIYELNQQDVPAYELKPGWHLQAVKAPEAWTITKGDANVRVAVVDDGIDPAHPMFKGRIRDAYNVYLQNNTLSIGSGHGTHTAALAVGSLEFMNQGAAGIAPECTLIPVQVVDMDICPLSALVSGIMYSVHQKADVINVSIGPVFEGLNALPPSMQDEIGQTRFKNVEQLWLRVTKLAAEKGSIIVFAAGNDDIYSNIPPENRSEYSISVGAVDNRLYPTEFTNYGPCTDISAPGYEIYSALPGENFGSENGTSMAAPIVTGGIALMKSLKKDLTVAEARNVLYKTGIQVYGYMPPMIQLNLALEAVKRGDFSVPEARPYRPIPDADRDAYNGTLPPSWDYTLPEGGNTGVLPWEEIPVGPAPGYSGGVPGTGVIDNGYVTDPVTGSRLPAMPPESGALPAPATGALPPATTTPTPGTVTPPGTPAEDYEAIRQMIDYYKEKIKELERQLPENRR